MIQEIVWDKDSRIFMRYISGSETVQDEIKVKFKGEVEEERMLPRASTCTITIFISRFLTSQSQFDFIMSNILKHGELWKTYDSI